MFRYYFFKNLSYYLTYFRAVPLKIFNRRDALFRLFLNHYDREIRVLENLIITLSNRLNLAKYTWQQSEIFIILKRLNEDLDKLRVLRDRIREFG